MTTQAPPGTIESFLSIIEEHYLSYLLDVKKKHSNIVRACYYNHVKKMVLETPEFESLQERLCQELERLSKHYRDLAKAEIVRTFVPVFPSAF